MCDAAGELADRLEAIRLPEPGLERTPRGDVARGDDHPGDRRVVEQVEPDGVHHAPAPVLVARAELDRSP